MEVRYWPFCQSKLQITFIVYFTVELCKVWQLGICAWTITRKYLFRRRWVHIPSSRFPIPRFIVLNLISLLQNGQHKEIFSWISSGKLPTRQFRWILTDLFFKTYELQLKCRSYPFASRKPRSINILTRCCDLFWPRRYPFAEIAFDGAATQPYIHDCTITLFEGAQTHYFCVFFKRHAKFPINKCTPELEAASFHGEAVVTKTSRSWHRAHVNMRGRDAQLSDFVMKK